MTRLVFLDLGSTAITDQGLASLEGLTRLQELNLGDTKISDKGLLHQRKLKYRRTLTIPVRRLLWTEYVRSSWRGQGCRSSIELAPAPAGTIPSSRLDRFPSRRDRECRIPG